MTATDPASILEEIRACLRKTKPSVPIDDDFDAISAENRLLKEEKRDLFSLLDSIEARLSERNSTGAGPSEENNRADGQQRGTSPAQKESDAQGNGGRLTPVRQTPAAKAPSSVNRTRWATLENKVRDAWETYSGDGKDPVHVWSQSDVKLTDDKIMANLQRQYALHLVGFPLQGVSPMKNGEAGPKVTHTPDDRRVNTTSPGATNKRNVSPSATNRLPPPNVVAVALRRSTPVRVTATPSKAPEKETPQKSVTPSRTGLGPDRVTPVRRSSTPLAGAKSPSPATTASKSTAAGKTTTGHVDPAKPSIRFAVKGSSESESKTATAPKPSANGTHSSKPVATTSATSSGAAKPLMGISAVLAQFKNIGPAETPRVPGDKRSPRPGLATAAPTNSASSASLKREAKNEVKLGFAYTKPPATAAATSGPTTAAKSRVTPLKR